MSFLVAEPWEGLSAPYAEPLPGDMHTLCAEPDATCSML